MENPMIKSTLTEREEELLKLVQEHDDPESALTIAVAIIVNEIKRLGSSEAPSPVCQQESV